MLKPKTQLSCVNGTWLLPIIAATVAASTGGIVAEVLPSRTNALWTLIVSYILWGMGFPMAMFVLIIYFHRLGVHKLPPPEIVVSAFIPLAPMGNSGFAVMQLGKVSMVVLSGHNLTSTPMAGQILYVLGFIIALMLWGLGLVWFFFAVASISRSKPPFSMGWWALTFPLGVYTLSTTTIGKELPSKFFNILGTVHIHRFRSFL
jgi:tellurite resistance protein TehA-like permease